MIGGGLSSAIWTKNLELPEGATCGRDATVRRRCGGCGFPSRAARRSGRWEFRRCEIGWCKRRCGTCWNRSSSGTSPRRATASAPSGGARTPCAGWTNCSKQGYTWVVDADLKSYFDTIPHDRLMDRVCEKVADGASAGRWCEAFLNQQVLDGMKSWTPEGGTPQGAVLSPLLANLYLDPLDHLMAEAGFAMVRYADDFVILCRSREEAERALERGARMDGDSRPDAASEQDADRGCQPGEASTFWAIASSEARNSRERRAWRSSKDAIRAKTRRTDGQSLHGDHRRREPHADGLV